MIPLSSLTLHERSGRHIPPTFATPSVLRKKHMEINYFLDTKTVLSSITYKCVKLTCIHLKSKYLYVLSELQHHDDLDLRHLLDFPNAATFKDFKKKIHKTLQIKTCIKNGMNKKFKNSGRFFCFTDKNFVDFLQPHVLY